MAGAARRMAAMIGLTAAALTLGACSGGSRPAPEAPVPDGDTYGIVPQRVLPAPHSMLAATELQAGGVIWTLTGPASPGLSEISSATGQVKSSFPVSAFARSVAESPTGVIALALTTGQTGGLQLVNATSRKVTRVVRFPWPAVQVAVAEGEKAGQGRGSSTFYVLTARAGLARVMIVTGDGRVTGTVTVPPGVVSVVPGTRQATLYALQRDGLLDQIGMPDGKLLAQIRAGSGGGESVTLSPDGRTVYVLEQLGGIANIAVVNPAARAVTKVLPAPGTCIQVLAAPGGHQLYEVVRAPRTGSIQVAAAG